MILASFAECTRAQYRVEVSRKLCPRRAMPPRREGALNGDVFKVSFDVRGRTFKRYSHSCHHCPQSSLTLLAHSHYFCRLTNAKKPLSGRPPILGRDDVSEPASSIQHATTKDCGCGSALSSESGKSCYCARSGVLILR